MVSKRPSFLAFLPSHRFSSHARVSAHRVHHCDPRYAHQQFGATEKGFQWSLRCHRNSRLHVGMDGTVVRKCSCCVEGELEGLILAQITGGVKGIGIAGHGMGCITPIRPLDRRSFGDRQRGWSKSILAILLNNLHLASARCGSRRGLQGRCGL